jgi:hypothetical protein
MELRRQKEYLCKMFSLDSFALAAVNVSYNVA